MTARAQIEVTASSNRLTSGLAAARSKVLRWAGAVARGVKGVTGNATVGNIIGNIQGKAMDFAGDAARDVMQFEKALTRFGIAASSTPEKLAALKSKIADVSKETAIGRGEILAGATAYVDLTGDAAGAEAAMRSFARISQASGASMEDVAGAAASMQMSMKLDAKDIEGVFSGLITQGKSGAVTLKDMAAELSTLGPMMAKFKGGTGADGIRAMGAAFQVVRQGAGNATEANTQLQSVITGIVNKAANFERAGVKIYDKDPKTGVKTLRSFADIIDGISKSRLMKDPTALGKAFGRTEALAAFNSLVKNRALYDELLEKGKDNSAVQKDLATYMESSAGKIDKAWNGLKLRMAEAFTPERIEKFASSLEKVLGMAGKLVGYIEDIADAVLVDIEKDTEKWAKQNDNEFTERSKKMTPEQKKKFADDMMKGVAELEGQTNPIDTAKREGMRRAAEKIYGEQDAWFTGSGASFNPVQTASTVAQVGTGQASVSADSTLGQILGELKKLNAKPSALNATIKADGNNIARTSANATDTRRTP